MDRPEYSGKERPKAGSATRPSGYDINEAAFARNEEGPLPGNLIIAGGAPGTDRYSRRCKEEGIERHPARYPTAVPRQIIQLTTAPGDLCYDPMAGSNTTGAVASELGRRFISTDPMLSYVHGSSFRFDQRADFKSHLPLIFHPHELD
jgi:site-specific DNA-methyltransferase (cytosine-N4-specific)